MKVGSGQWVVGSLDLLTVHCPLPTVFRGGHMNHQKVGTASAYLAIMIALLILPMKGELQERKPADKLRFAISFPAERSQSALDGRVLLMISTDGSQEPRAQINDGPKTQQIFGIDVDGLKPGQPAFVDGAVFGYPRKSLREVPAGTYWIQALLHNTKRSNGPMGIR